MQQVVKSKKNGHPIMLSSEQYRMPKTADRDYIWNFKRLYQLKQKNEGVNLPSSEMTCVVYCVLGSYPIWFYICVLDFGLWSTNILPQYLYGFINFIYDR